MNKEQPNLFPRAEKPEEGIFNEPDVPKEISEEAQGAKRKRYADKKAAEKAFVAGRRKILGETKDGQQESFRE